MVIPQHKDFEEGNSSLSITQWIISTLTEEVETKGARLMSLDGRMLSENHQSQGPESG